MVLQVARREKYGAVHHFSSTYHLIITPITARRAVIRVIVGDMLRMI